MFLAACNSTSVMGSVKASHVSSQTTSSISGAPVPSVGVGENQTATAPPALPSGSELAQRDEIQAAGVPVAYAAAYPRPDNLMSTPEVFSSQFRDAHPIDFGTRAPHRHTVHGVDVSHWQGKIDWATLRKQGANFAFVKATEGGKHVDPRFEENWNGAAQAGIKRGAYHFYFWCRPAHEQAEWFIRNVPRAINALPPVLDVEWNDHSRECRTRPSPAKVVSEMQIFLDLLESHYGQRPIIYATVDFYRDNLRGRFTDYPFWLRSVAAHPEEVYPGREWVFWQYSGTGLSKGLGGKIDLNVFRGSKADWHKWLGQSIHRGA